MALDSGPVHEPRDQSSASRDITLGLFHAIGKVMYNKREVIETCQPPPFLKAYHRPLAITVDITKLFDMIGADFNTFLPGLQENYAVSCGGKDSLSCIEAISEELSCVDLADTTGHLGFANGHVPWSDTATSELLQHREMVFETGVRAVLFHLPYPVNRQIVSGSGPSQKISYPVFAKVRKKELEIRSALDQRLGQFPRPTKISIDGPQGECVDPLPRTLADPPNSSILSVGPLTRLGYTDMVLFNLPYQELINSLPNNADSSPVSLLTHFDPSLLGGTHKASGSVKSPGLAAIRPEAMPTQEQLVLSDDDIEDC